MIIKAAAVYFLIVFGAGFVLGTVRVLLVVPHVGVRTAELAETPLMIAVCFFTARSIVARFRPSAVERVGIGLIALALLLAAELSLVYAMQRLTLAEYIESRDPISGAAYGIALVLFAIMPLLIRNSS